MGAAASTVTGDESESSAKLQGDKLFQAEDFAGAIYWYSLAIQATLDLENDHANEEINAGKTALGILHSNRSAAFLGLKSFTHALEDAQFVIEKCPKWVKGYFRAGAALLQLGQRSEAIDHLNKALTLEPLNQSLVDLLQEAKNGFRGIERGQGHCFTWGCGANGSLGQGNTSDKETPRLVDELRGKYITDVACGIAHTLAVTAEGDLFAWGRNSESACGIIHEQGNRDSDHIILVPRVVTKLLGISISAVSCGAGHSVALANDGSVYTWGLNKQGQCGLQSLETVPEPRRMESLQDKSISAVACGIAHTVFVDSNSEVMGCGWNNVGQLGLGHTENCYSPGQMAKDCGPVSHIACGGGHTCVISKEGKLFSTGSGTCGQLGLGTESDRQEFEQVGEFSSFAFVACGEEFTVAITKERTVYAFGLGIAGQMGNGTTQSSLFPKKVEGLADKKVEFVACSQGQVMAVTQGGDCYTWGTPGSLAHMALMDPSVIITEPQKVGALSRKNIQVLACGRKHYCAVTVWTYAPFCTLTGIPDDEEVKAGKRLKFVIQSRDNMGSDRTSGGEMVRALAVSDPDDPELMLAERAQDSQEDIEIFDEMNGKYSGTAKLKVAGVYRIQISICGMQIQGSPFELKIIPAPVCPDKCSAWWGKFLSQTQNLTNNEITCPKLMAHAKDSLSFTVTLRDAYGNRCRDLADEVILSVSEKQSAMSNDTVFEGSFKTAAPDGMVACLIPSLTKSGTYVVNVCINSQGNHIKGSPFNLEVTPGAVDASQCFCEGEGLLRGTVGVDSLFRLYLRNCNGNEAELPEDMVVKANIAAEVYDISHYALLYLHKNDPTKPVKCKVVQEGKGWIEFSYNVVVASTSLVKVLVGNQPVQGSPFMPVIQAHKVSASMSLLCVPKDLAYQSSESKINSDTNLVDVEFRDMYGNRTHDMGDFSVECILKTEEDLSVLSPHSTAEGKVTFDIGLLQEQIQYEVSATIGGVHIMKSPFKLHEPEDIRPANNPIMEKLEKVSEALDVDNKDETKEEQKDANAERILSSKEMKRLERLKKEELTRKRALEALKREQTKRKAQREERRKKASCRRTGGGFVIQYSQDI